MLFYIRLRLLIVQRETKSGKPARSLCSKHPQATGSTGVLTSFDWQQGKRHEDRVVQGGILAQILHQFACKRTRFSYDQIVIWLILTFVPLQTTLDAPSLVFLALTGTCSLRPSLDATLRAAIAVQIVCPADLSLNQTNLLGADLDARRAPAGCAARMGRISYGYAFGRRHPSVPKIRRDHRIHWCNIWAYPDSNDGFCSTRQGQFC